MTTLFQGGWDESATVKDVFPPLSLISDVPLAAPALDLVPASPAEADALRTLRGALLQPPNGNPDTTVAWVLDSTLQGMLTWPGVGLEQREELLNLLGQMSAEVYVVLDGRVAIDVDDDEAISLWELAAPIGINERVQWLSSMAMLAAWTATLTGIATWQNLTSLAEVPRPPEVEVAWTSLMSAQLPSNGESSAGAIVSSYLQSQAPRDLSILLERIIGRERTLDSIASDWGVTRERIRQRESAVAHDLRFHYEQSEGWLPVRWATNALAHRVGGLAPASALDLALPGTDERASSVIMWLADYRLENGLLLSRDFRWPSIGELERLRGATKVIDEFALIESLTAMGIHEGYFETVVGRINGLHRVEGQLVDWTGSQTDKVVALLELHDEPQDLEALYEVLDGGSIRSFRQRVFDDPRISRVTKSKVGLAAWGGTRYTTIVDLMATRLASGPLTIEELSREMQEMYEVSPNSVAMCAYAPVFKVTGETVALRKHDDPFHPRHRPETVVGLLRLSTDCLVWHLPVDRDILRGSGRALPSEIGTYLGLAPGEPGLLIRNSLGHIPVAWSEMSHTGPTIGSLQSHAVSLGATQGDTLRLTFDKAKLEVEIAIVPPPVLGESPAARLSRLSGLSASQCQDLEALGMAIEVHAPDVVDALRKRGDDDLAAAAESVEGHPVANRDGEDSLELD